MTKSLTAITALLPLMFSCAHKGLDRSLKDSALDGLRHESLSRYTARDLSKLKGFKKHVATCHQGRYNEALSLFKDVLDQNQKNPIYWNHLGTCYYLKGEHPKSLIYLDIAMGLTKNKSLLAAVHNNIGLNHLKQGNLAEALASFKKASGLDGSALTPKYNLAQLYLSKGLYDRAEKVLRGLSARNSGDVDVNYSLAHLKLMQKKYQSALRWFRRIPNEYLKRDDVALNLAATYYAMGRPKLALKTLDHADAKAAEFTLRQTELKKRIERQSGELAQN